MPTPIFSRAPLHMRYSRESYFEPKFVSIGPLYYEKLREERVMEKAKDKCISYFASKLPNTSNPNINNLVEQINVAEVKDRIQLWYGKSFVHPEEFFRMLVRDSCFIIRIILAFSREGEESMFYPGVDIKTIRFDLLLLENQIPFFFLKKVYYFLRDKDMLPPVQYPENFPSKYLPQNDFIQSSPQGHSWVCCLPIPKQWHISQSTVEQSQRPGPQSTQSLEQNQSHEPQSTLSLEQSQSHEPKSTLSLEQSQGHSSQSTLSLEKSQSHSSQSTLSIEQSPSHSPLRKSTLSIEQSQGHSSQSTLSLEQSQSHSSQSTLSIEQNPSHSPPRKTTPPIEQSSSHSPLLKFVLSREQSQSHSPLQEPTLSIEQSQSHSPLRPATLKHQLSSFSLDQSESPSRQSSPIQTTIFSDDEFLKELKPFIWLDMPWQFYQHTEFTEPKHLLDLYWKWCIPSPSNGQGNNTWNQLHDDGVHASWVKIHLRSNARKRIKSAYELYRKAGVTFQKREHIDGFGVTFQKGILQIPHMQLDPNQTALLANLVAFEEFKPSKERLLTSYVLLLDGLINTEKDVELLQRNGVITNKLSSSEMASTYLNDIGNVCTVDYKDHYCRKQFDDLDSYYNSKWNNHFAKLRHKYFNSPWAVISFSAGAILLIFSGLQTVYNIERYYQNR